MSDTPLERLSFPVVCTYPDCGAGPFTTGAEVDEHITEEHLPEAIWSFAEDAVRPIVTTGNQSIVWLTTLPNPRGRNMGYDCGQKGWRLHAIYGDPKQTCEELGRARSLCGVHPRYGWGMDLFIEDPCLRCVAKAMALGLEVPPEIAHTYKVNRILKDDINAWRKDPEAYNVRHAHE